MISIRSAGLGDAAAIARVHVQSWRTTYAGLIPEAYLAGLDEGERASAWEQWLQMDVCVLVAEVDGAVVGFASGGALREPLGEYDGELYAIYVLERAQRSGIGRELLTEVAAVLRGKGFESMAVWVLAGNPAVGFYRHAGAVEVGEKRIEIGGVELEELALGWAQGVGGDRYVFPRSARRPPYMGHPR